MYGNSAEYYSLMRARRRRWAMGPQGLSGYAQFLAGYGDTAADVSSVVGAETAAMDSAMGDTALRSIAIGVTTGVVTYLLNRWLGKVFG
jgi:hypothetical protein